MAGMDRELMNGLYKQFNLTQDDVFAHRHYKIITRAGIDKIQAAARIHVTYDLLYHTADLKTAIVKAKGVRYDEEGKITGVIESFGEVSEKNNMNEYPIAMAEKRAMARVVLKLAGLYAEGFFSEDESNEFGETVKRGRNQIGAGNVEVKSL